MLPRNTNWLYIFLTVLFGLLMQVAPAHTAILIDHSSTNLGTIPGQWIAAAKQDLHIVYNHTSHGKQIITGMNALKGFPEYSFQQYNWIDDSQGNIAALSLDDIYGTDLSRGDSDDDHDGIDNWAEDTADFLADLNNYHINVVMWSWCSIEGHNIPRYLESMEWLIGQFGKGGTHIRAFAHPVQFVFMTGHAEGDGEDGARSDALNDIIRAHCAANDRILFDFADLENYDPDNNYFLDKNVTDALFYNKNGGEQNANWAVEYIARHDGSELDKLTTGENVNFYGGCDECAHSDGPNNLARLNCVLKGRAAWHLFARLAGWQAGPADQDPPVRSNGKPTGTLGTGTHSTMMSLHTNENATCKYATTPDSSYSAMTKTFSATGLLFHSTLATGLQNGSSYSFYIRCNDEAGNANVDDFVISFAVDSPPPAPHSAAVMPPILYLMLN
jgi:hypothetical protein